MALVSQQSFAKKIGVSRQRINFLVKNGTLAPAVVKIRGKKFLNEDLALSILNKSLDPTKQHNQMVSSEYQAARLENLSYQNKIMARQLEEKASRNIPARVASILAGERNEIKVMKILADEIDQALNDLIEEIDKAGI